MTIKRTCLVYTDRYSQYITNVLWGVLSHTFINFHFQNLIIYTFKIKTSTKECHTIIYYHQQKTLETDFKSRSFKGQCHIWFIKYDDFVLNVVLSLYAPTPSINNKVWPWWSMSFNGQCRIQFKCHPKFVVYIYETNQAFNDKSYR